MKVFCDESSIDGQPYFLIGSIWVRDDYEPVLRQALDAYRTTPGLKQAVFKWTSVMDRDPWGPVYRGWVDTFCQLARPGTLEYRCIVIASDGVDHGTYNGGDKERGFYKFYYQLLFHPMKRSRDYYHAYLASRGENPSDVDDLARILNRGLDASRSGSRVLSVDSRPECEDTLIQLADLMTGAVSFHLHQRQLDPGSRRAKVDLAQRIADSIGRQSLDLPCSGSIRPFNVWHFQLSPSAKKRPPRSLPSSRFPVT